MDMIDPTFVRSPQIELPSAPTALNETAPPTEEQMLDLAREFESMLILQMLRQMQRSVLSEDGGDTGFGSGPLGDTLHQEVARQLSQVGGFGLAGELAQALGRQSGATADGPGEDGAVGLGTLAAPSELPGPASSGRVRAPSAAVPLPIGSTVTSRFGWRSDPFSGQSRFHSGVDIRASQGDPVPAAKAGRVVFAGDQGGYGTTVVLEHEGGVRTRYAHLSSLDVQVGDQVAAGQIVGAVGATGRATGPHLHFEVLDGQRRLDPILAARRFSEALKKVEQVADLNDGGSKVAQGSLWSSE